VLRDRLARRHARPVDPARLVLCASTSEAYAWLFKLLCDPGDHVLVPQPSYPLFDHLAALESVVLRPYPLRHHAGWHLSIDELSGAIDERTRAILIVNPNNPTGSFLHRDEHARLVELAAARGLAIVSDEVFAESAAGEDPDRVTTLIGDSPALTFCLSGLSKLVGLPQLKLGWIHVGGPASSVAAAEERLELIADTYLSVATPVQWAAPRLLALVDDLGVQLRSRVGRNREQLRRALAGSTADLLGADGGWSAIVRAPSTRSEEEWVLALIEDGVLVHPGFFFDLDGTHLVLSTLPEAAIFDDAIARLRRRLDAL
jgi:aspartate/methionine/tyrosine aminotransferase